MKKLLIFSLLIPVFGFLSCNSGEKQAETLTPADSAIQHLHDEVISIHDELMPKMSDVMRLKGALAAKKDSLSAPLQDSVTVLIGDLEAADDAMMSWMRQFKPKQTDSTRLKEYYEEQLKEIRDVQARMNKAIENSSKFQKTPTK